MSKIGIVIPYFGNFKPSSQLFFESCRRNEKVDWLIFTDNAMPNNLSKNVIWNSCRLADVENRAKSFLDPVSSISKAYKLCDYKPMYGKMFSDCLSSYDYWGYGDLDVVYGNLEKWFSKIQFKKYEKINKMGHFVLMKNNEECRNAWRTGMSGVVSPLTVLKDGKQNYGFDERDFNQICIQSGLKTFDGIFAADIDVFYKRMRCVDRKTIHKLCGFEGKWEEYPINYRRQLFCLVGGKVYRYYIKNGYVGKDEFAYIHFRQEVPVRMRHIESGNFIISRNGFFDLECPEKLCERGYLSNLIKKYNAQENFLLEEIRYLRGLINAKI